MTPSNSITVFAPASVANVGPGFDILGFALNGIGDRITLTQREDEQLIIEPVGADLPLHPSKNVATVALKSFCNHVGHKGGFDIKIEKNFKPGSGLGSSASSAVGTVFAANELLKAGLTKEELIPFALDGEEIASKNRHADNIAPCMLGGFVGVKSCDPYEGFSVDYPDDLTVLIIFPDVVIKTAEARQLLPKTIDLGKGIQQAANMASLMVGLMRSNYSMIRASLKDEFAEPYRTQLIPFFDAVKKLALEHGAEGLNISGSGPAMFAFFEKEKETSHFMEEVRDIYESKEIHVTFHQSEINKEGVKVIDA